MFCGGFRVDCDAFLAPFPMVYIFRSIFVLRKYADVLMLVISTAENNFDC